MPRKRRPSELLAPGEYERMLEAQGGVCAICGNPPKEGGRRFHVDHDHGVRGSLRVRGLLCYRCNNALPAWIDCDWLVKAIDYLDSTHIDNWVRGR